MTNTTPDSAPLVDVFPALVHGEEQLLCDARQLHQLLNVGKVFASWIKDRIEEYEFVAGVDYHIATESLGISIFPINQDDMNIPQNWGKIPEGSSEFSPNLGKTTQSEGEDSFSQIWEKPNESINADNIQKDSFPEFSGKPVNVNIDVDIANLYKTIKNPKGGRPTKEYILTLDMAKELAMVEKSDIGRKVRKYFIECERQSQNLQFKLLESYKDRLANIVEKKRPLDMNDFIWESTRISVWAYRFLSMFQYFKAPSDLAEYPHYQLLWIYEQEFVDLLNRHNKNLVYICETTQSSSLRHEIRRQLDTIKYLNNCW
ncbi:antA/AntB antirepressor family protein [Snodgrassella alvi]|uniref:antA/AntB antirepressor family protein n=1 Tax=Snodgrassella alvi TaxID=1196083 RepID=UPI00352E977F